MLAADRIVESNLTHARTFKRPVAPVPKAVEAFAHGCSVRGGRMQVREGGYGVGRRRRAAFLNFENFSKEKNECHC